MPLFKRNKQNATGSSLKNPKILEVNLIKEEAQLDFNWRRNLGSLLFALGVTVFIILEIYFGLSWWQKDEETRLLGLQKEIKTISTEISQMRVLAKDALSYQAKTKEVGSLLDNHVYWSNFFSWLEKNTLSTVTFDGFSGNLTGEYSLSGTAGSFAEVSWQAKKMLEAPFVKSVDILNAASGEVITKEDLEAEADSAKAQEEAGEEGEAVVVVKPPAPPGVSFALTLEIDPEVFKK
jgi:Tfp pilus assembly protein PilN